MSPPNGLPEGWEVKHSKSRNLPYYFHAATQDSRWEPPQGTDPEQLKAYMAQHHSESGENIPQATQDGANDKIRAAHLLVKHSGSRRPSSWRNNDITMSKNEAMQIIRQHQERIRNGEIGLGDLAVTESDCSSARKRGDLGFFGKGDMQKEFENAAFKLKPGEMSDVVESASGLHLIQRLE